MSLPAAYAWLNGLFPLPRMTAEALKVYGVKEGVGDADNPEILAWAKEVGLESVYRHDATAWCGLFAALIAKRAGKTVVNGPLWALNWARFGVPSPAPALGDVLVFVRPGGGHVGLYVAEDASAYHVLGGNTSDAVSIARIAKERLKAARRPVYSVQPATVKPYHVAATGALSTNEA